MGTHKKHSKDRRKHRHRDRDQSLSSSPDSRRYHRDERSGKRASKRTHSTDNDTNSKEHGKRAKHTSMPNDIEGSMEDERAGGVQHHESLNIADTNALRAKLGLKPLEVDEQVEEQIVDGYKKYTDKGDEFLHAPAHNIGAIKKTALVKEKVALIKEKRELNKKLGKVKNIADSDSDDESAGAWVEKMRKQHLQKEEAAKRAKLLEELDETFGVGDLVEEEMKVDVRKHKDQAYTSRHLAGLSVGHAREAIPEGRSVVLTLEDKDVLEETGDKLINVNIIDKEKADKNVERRKGKPAYTPFEPGDVDEYGQMKVRDILYKYDDEIHGEKQESFTLGRGGVVNMDDIRQEERVKAELKRRGESLESKPLVLASEYYTEEEMVKFKKPGKKKKIRKRQILKADDLLASVTALTENPIPGLGADHGSRLRGRYRVDDTGARSKLQANGRSDVDQEQQEVVDMDIDTLPEAEQADILGPEVDLSGVKVEEEQTDKDMQADMNKARKLKQLKEKIAAAKKADKTDGGIEVKSEPAGDDEQEAASIVLNQTSEFCRTLGDIPTYGQAGNRDDMDEDELLDFERELLEERKRQLITSSGGTDDPSDNMQTRNWNEVSEEKEDDKNKDEEGRFMDEEPTVGPSVISALKVAKVKGYIDDEAPRRNANVVRTAHLQAQNFLIEESTFEDKFTAKQRDRFSAGPLTDFREKDGYKPKVKIEYPDEHGRLMGPKEAFRYLSHRFHGKASGKLKTEKRSRKQQEDQLMKKMSSTDTPLETLNKLQQQQRRLQSPYVTLTGGNKNTSADVSSIAKSK